MNSGNTEMLQSLNFMSISSGDTAFDATQGVHGHDQFPFK
jgi:hypothetical protein